MESVQVETPAGEIEVKLCLPAGEHPVALALMVHGMSPERDIIWEWGGVAEELRQRKTATAGTLVPAMSTRCPRWVLRRLQRVRGARKGNCLPGVCVYPNLHSCDLTAPACAKPEDVAAALEAIAAWGLLRVGGGGSGAVPLLVYGKSWGGAQAIELCARLAAAKPPAPAPAAGLCLACPSTGIDQLTEKVASVAAPALLVWAKDDAVIPFDMHGPLLEELRARPAGATIFAPTEAGGHRVDRMAALDSTLAAKLAEWPDLALGPLAAASSLR
uniref:Phospholipase/carboxylesterase/thioesterase domain-containing protein n=1 Tax=Alexandrium monilatum TaxID=311494 RepID=A0A7S4PS46_9DINO